VRRSPSESGARGSVRIMTEVKGRASVEPSRGDGTGRDWKVDNGVRGRVRSPAMERVLGVGGIFFKAKDPAKLKAWYRDHLGLPRDEQGETMFPTQGDPGPCLIWAPFPADTTYFEPSNAPFMINFRVKDLRAMLAQLRETGAAVDDK